MIAYYDEFFLSNEGWLVDGVIFESEMLKELLKESYPEFQFKEHYFIVRKNKTTEMNAIKDEIVHVWGNSVLHTFKELDELLPFIPLEKIKYALSYPTDI